MQALLRRNSGLASQVISLPPFQVDLSRQGIFTDHFAAVADQGFHNRVLKGRQLDRLIVHRPRMPNCVKAIPSTC
jgi:hypothetical protein